MTHAVLVAMLAGLALGCAARGPTASSPAPVGERWTTPADFGELRERYGARHDFAEVCVRGRPLHETLDEIAEKDWTAALALSEGWLASCPVDMDAHYLAAVALTELGRDPEARAHVDWYRGLVESVLASGDGHTPETAWAVISAQEEYSILQALHVELLERRALESNVDAMTVEAEGQTRVFYFRPVEVGSSPPAGSQAD